MTTLSNATSQQQTGIPAAQGSTPPAVSRVVRRLAWIARGTRLSAALAGGLLLIGLVVLADAFWPMGASVRWVLLGAVLLAGFVAVLWALVPRRPSTRTALHGATCIEQQLALVAQPIVTAMTFPTEHHQRDAFADALQARALAGARSAAQLAQPKAAVPLSLLLRPLDWLCFSASLWIILAVVVPTLPGTGLARLFAPWADVGPYSVTRFTVRWVPDVPTSSDTVVVLAKPSGRDPREVVAVLLDDALQPIERRVMQPTTHGYELTLIDLRQAVTFHVEAHGRRTRRYTITPQPATKDEDDLADQNDTVANPQDAGTLHPGPSEGGERAALPEQMGQLAGLINDLARLAEQASDALHSDAPLDPALEDQLRQLNVQASELAEQLSDLADNPNAGDALAQAIDALAQSLRNLEVSGVASTMPIASDDPADADAAQAWREALAQAARNDAARLAQGLGDTQALIDSGLSNRSGDPNNSVFRDPDATGGYDEALGSAERGVLPDALMRRVPARYRQQTAEYFRRLVEDNAHPQEETP